MLILVVSCLLALSAAQGDMSIVLLTDAVSSGVGCIDGSPVAYYIRRNASNTNWAMYFQGGGWCFTGQQCYERAQTVLGSSTTYPSNLTSGGVLSNNPQINPDFYQWNAVYLAYCDGGSWTGSNQDAVYYQGTPLYFRGKWNKEAVFANLSAAGMSDATNILVTGCSAGGLATYQHVDYIAQLFPEAVVKAAPVSGFFLPIGNMQGVDVYTQEMQAVFEMQNSTSGVHPGCLAANPSNPSMCIFAPYVYPHIASPVFILNSFYDIYQLTCILAADSQTATFGNCGSSLDAAFGPCFGNPINCTASQVTYLNTAFRGVMLGLMSNATTWANPQNGAFVDSCMAHCETLEVYGPGGFGAVADWSSMVIDGVDATQAVGDWYFGRASAQNHRYIDCAWTSTSPVACNPSCGQQ